MSSRKCLRCKKTMRPIGRARKNGVGYNDWTTRKYCKQCHELNVLEMIYRAKNQSEENEIMI